MHPKKAPVLKGWDSMHRYPEMEFCAWITRAFDVINGLIHGWIHNLMVLLKGGGKVRWWSLMGGRGLKSKKDLHSLAPLLPSPTPAMPSLPGPSFALCWPLPCPLILPGPPLPSSSSLLWRKGLGFSHMLFPPWYPATAQAHSIRASQLQDGSSNALG